MFSRGRFSAPVFLYQGKCAWLACCACDLTQPYRLTRSPISGRRCCGARPTFLFAHSYRAAAFVSSTVVGIMATYGQYVRTFHLLEQHDEHMHLSGVSDGMQMFAALKVWQGGFAVRKNQHMADGELACAGWGV